MFHLQPLHIIPQFSTPYIIAKAQSKLQLFIINLQMFPTTRKNPPLSPPYLLITVPWCLNYIEGTPHGRIGILLKGFSRQ